MDYLIVECPHCSEPILIFKKEINCKIFRHGVLKSTNQQIDPHLPKSECEFLVKNEKIYGCGGPFKIENECSVICDYL